MRYPPLLAALFVAAVAALPLTVLGAQAAPPQASAPQVLATNGPFTAKPQ